MSDRLMMIVLGYTVACILSVVGVAAFAQTLPPNPAGMCALPENQDTWRLEPHPQNEGEYLFTYTNSEAKCSDNYDGVAITADDGFKVYLYVRVSAEQTDDELIWVVPEDGAYVPVPAEVLAPDSSVPYEIRLIPGMV